VVFAAVKKFFGEKLKRFIESVKKAALKSGLFVCVGSRQLFIGFYSSLLLPSLNESCCVCGFLLNKDYQTL